MHLSGCKDWKQKIHSPRRHFYWEECHIRQLKFNKRTQSWNFRFIHHIILPSIAFALCLLRSAGFFELVQHTNSNCTADCTAKHLFIHRRVVLFFSLLSPPFVFWYIHRFWFLLISIKSNGKNSLFYSGNSMCGFFSPFCFPIVHTQTHTHNSHIVY